MIRNRFVSIRVKYDFFPPALPISIQQSGCRITIESMDSFIAKVATIDGKVGTPTRTPDKSARNAITSNILGRTEW